MKISYQEEVRVMQYRYVMFDIADCYGLTVN